MVCAFVARRPSFERTPLLLKEARAGCDSDATVVLYAVNYGSEDPSGRDDPRISPYPMLYMYPTSISCPCIFKAPRRSGLKLRLRTLCTGHSREQS
jgi:hypothetical protein